MLCIYHYSMHPYDDHLHVMMVRIAALDQVLGSVFYLGWLDIEVHIPQPAVLRQARLHTAAQR